jgi:hypothetical protein
MSRAALEKQLEELRNCPICRKGWTNPVILDCAHTFCDGCLTAVLLQVPHIAFAGKCPECQGCAKNRTPASDLIKKLQEGIQRKLNVYYYPPALTPHPCEDTRQEKRKKAAAKRIREFASTNIPVFITFRGAMLFDCEVEAEVKIGQLKEDIFEKVGIPPHHQEWIGIDGLRVCAAKGETLLQKWSRMKQHEFAVDVDWMPEVARCENIRVEEDKCFKLVCQCDLDFVFPA